MYENYTSNITHHRGNARVWLEGSILERNGFSYHTPYFVEYGDDYIALTKSTEGAKKVSGRKRKGAADFTPIIDLCNRKVTAFMGDDTTVYITFYNTTAVITKRAELKKVA